MPLDRIGQNASTLIIAGSETTATLLCGVVFFLTTNPTAMKTLTKEVRSTFGDDREITLSSVQDLQYMLSCLNEALRLYPPVTFGLPRLVPAGGAVVAGNALPEKASWQAPPFTDDFAADVPARPSSLFGNGPSTATRGFGHDLTSSSPSGGWGMLGLPTTSSRQCSRSAWARGTVLARSESRHIPGEPGPNPDDG